MKHEHIPSVKSGNKKTKNEMNESIEKKIKNVSGGHISPVFPSLTDLKR